MRSDGVIVVLAIDNKDRWLLHFKPTMSQGRRRVFYRKDLLRARTKRAASRETRRARKIKRRNVPSLP